MDAINRHKMTLTLPSDLEFALTRVFNAPRKLVFAAWTDAKHVRNWYGCDAFELSVCAIDLRVGGAYRYTMREPGGRTHTIHGIYRDIAAPARLIYTQGYVTEGFTSPEAIVTVTFLERDGQTTLTSTVLHNSRADRDAHLASGVETGAAVSFDRLEAHLRTMG